jgi:hypothetical protein
MSAIPQELRGVDGRQRVKHYQGRRQGNVVLVTVNGRLLNPRFDLRNHSPTGFEWGYHGSGPAQLALALLADCLQNDAIALDLYQNFKRVIVANMERDGWALSDKQIKRVANVLKIVAYGDFVQPKLP